MFFFFMAFYFKDLSSDILYSVNDNKMTYEFEEDFEGDDRGLNDVLALPPSVGTARKPVFQVIFEASTYQIRGKGITNGPTNSVRMHLEERHLLGYNAL
jgi:hypothetical protein